MSTDHLLKRGIVELNGGVISGLPRPLVTDIYHSWSHFGKSQKTLYNSETGRYMKENIQNKSCDLSAGHRMVKLLPIGGAT
jgi:hypothetical protein